MAKIVVIEDNVQNARMVEKLLKRAGHTVLLAEDGELGLTTVFEERPDLVLIDLGLPDIDGQTVISVIKQQPTLNDMVVLAFTAWPPEEARDMAKRYGCDGVITKPIQTRTFADEIMAFLSKKQAAVVKNDDVSTEKPDETVVKKDNVSAEKPDEKIVKNDDVSAGK